MNKIHGGMRLLAAAVLCWALALTAAFAQQAVARGSVKMEDGSPVAKALVSVEATSGTKPLLNAKTAKDGSFIFPFVESDTYRFAVEKEGLLIKSISVKILLPNKQEESAYSSDVGALQQLPEFRLGMSRAAEIEFVMVPKSYFADAIVVMGDEEATKKLSEANDLAIARRFEESNAILKELVEQNRENSKVCYLLGSNAYALGDMDEAMKWFERTQELDAEQPGLHAHLGSIAHERGDLEQALAEYERELEISPQASVIAVNRAVLLVELDRKEEAIEAFKQVVEINPGETAAYSELAALYLDLGREDEAAAVLQKLDELGSTDPAMWFNIGAGHSNRDEYDEAEAAYRKALEIDPNFAEAVREMGYLFIRKGDHEAAVSQFERYLKLKPAAADSGDIRALIDALRKQRGGE